SPCVNFDLEVKDDDTPEVAIRANGPMPDTATVETVGKQRARFRWCPTDSQLNTALSWTLTFEADDGQHVPTRHAYLVVFRRAAKAGCAGEPPVVTILTPAPGAIVASTSGFEVTASVTDDNPIRDEPILYFTTNDPGGAPDISAFAQTVFSEEGDNWVAQVPPVADPTGEPTPVWFIVSAVDNDDETGTACDKRTDSDVSTFLAVMESGAVSACELCSSPINCLSGICASEGICVSGCSDSECDCQELVTIEGGTASSCGGTAICLDPPPAAECVADSFSNPDANSALSLLGGALAGTICGVEESDWYKFTSGLDTNLTWLMKDLNNVDLDLELLDEQGNQLLLASTLASVEEASYCVSAGSVTYARVHAYPSATTPQGSYEISAQVTPGDCCKNDDMEPNNSLTAASNVGTAFAGMLCPLDKDFLAFTTTSENTVNIAIDYAQGTGLDIAIHGPLPSSTKIGTAFGIAGTAEWTGALKQAGEYIISVQTFGAQTISYGGFITIGFEVECSDTGDCPIGTACYEEDGCLPDNCQSVLECPEQHICAPHVDDAFGLQDKLCVKQCILDGECRIIDGEACKWLGGGRSCALVGVKQAGKSCESFEECAGNMGCYDWPGGYCTRMNCDSDEDCGPGTWCGAFTSGNRCLVECGGFGDTACRQDEGYDCALKLDAKGDFRNGCMADLIDI
ncbi:MAG: hypothetical protein ACI9WU_001495, partial [Myxococcota bacterium]